MMATEASPTDVKVVRLNASFDAFGMVVDMLARARPFAEYPASRLAAMVRHQLSKGFNFAAVTEAGELLGYAGWTPTLRASAELWLANQGSLKILDDMAKADAVALTTVVSRSPEVTSRLMRAARSAHPGVQVFFKRGYDGGVRPIKKQSVTVIGGQ